MEPIGLLILTTPFLLAGWLRFQHRRRVHDRRAARTTSRKLRVEREP